MLFSLFHFFTGYCRVVLSGANQERFLNLCVGKQILLWNVKKEGSVKALMDVHVENIFFV